jgi:phosphopantothenoylcysteine decarboxylase
MANVLLGVTGSVAAVRTPALFAALTKSGHTVRVVATDASLYFFDPVDIVGDSLRESPILEEMPARGASGLPLVTVDADEWPGREAGRRYQRDDPVLHIELRRWADLFVIAPLDANTLAKLANGLADNCLTCVWRAWDPARPVVLAPAMNTLMWQHPLTVRHLRQIAETVAAEPVPKLDNPEALIDWINATVSRLQIITPVSKRLACGDVGQGAMGELEEIVDAVRRAAAGITI